MENLLKIGITHGDINGISYEIILKALSDSRILEQCIPILYGSPKVVAFYRKMFEINNINFSIIRSASDANYRKLYIVNCCSDEIKVEVGKQTVDAGTYALNALEIAANEWKAGKIDALVTAPINKSTIQSDKFHFPGHTEYLEQIAGGQSVMILLADSVRVALATNHVPVHKISEKLTKEVIINKLKVLNKSLVHDFSITCPRIAVLGLNPHSSDNGLLGDEEQNIIKPAIDEANYRGITCTGPLSADGFWGSGAFANYDAILAMYHDQGLAPFKALFQDSGVNYTAGLPFVRTSPAHGTAYNLAGKNAANPSSFLQAIYLAIDVVKNRKMHKEASINPLKVEKMQQHNSEVA
ncbi:MAG: 4-hydroxythreonine-4-phosphate dehydrogenase PdxA [Prevotellaceae bacterium]|jgi:4-hydroxythreonine-4-phosphate dehydrogenase|nr:4-hydroxythreonine-4-phosphate dehydrogenase PdxA [Prevotellaceae bacterium]